MPTGVGAGKAKIFIYRVQGIPELPLMFLKFGHRGEYGKVRYVHFFGREFTNYTIIYGVQLYGSGP
jgi:hypothetical protein